MTLAEVLEARGGPLEEEEVWALLLTSAESLLDLFSIGKACSQQYNLITDLVGSYVYRC